MKTSAAGRALIAQREGRRLSAYRDTKGILTIGVGHTGRMSPPKVTAGMTITEAECDAMLAADLAPVEAAINAAVRVPLGQNEFDAMASLGFNIGAAGLRTSSTVKRLNLGDVAGAAQAFLLWDHPTVLAKRRAEERAQFLAPDSGAAPDNQSTVASLRADALAARAAKIEDDAISARRAAAAAAAVGSVGAALAAHGHLTKLAIVLGLIVVCGVGIDMIVARRRRDIAAALAVNAARQGVVAASSREAGSAAATSHP